MAPDEVKETVDLFTDRMRYRPGQPVYVSGVAYRQTGDEVKVRSGRSMDVVLRDANRKEIGKKQVVTDDFGGFSAEFMLPETTLPGDFQMTAAGENTHFIRVEAYKRPTFDVTFSPYKKSYHLGDTLTVEGKAMNFSGVPVRNGKVRYTLTRTRAWFWRADNFREEKKAYHLGDTLTVEGKAMNFSGVPVRNGKVRYTLTRTRAWFWRADGWAEEIAQGEASTDADGHFEVEACLQKPDYADDQPWQGYYRYQVKAEVTDGAGETQSGTLTLAVGSQSLSLRVEGLREKVMREKEEKVRFMARNVTDGAGETQSGTLTLAVGSQSLSLRVEGLREKVMREKEEKVRFMARNLNGKPVDVTIYYKVYALGSQSLSLRVEGLREKVMREKEEKVRFMARNLNGKPVDVTIYYKVYALNEKGEKGERVQSASIPSNVDDVDIVPSLLLNLPSGRYRVEYRLCC